jgi:hypothetical protein
MNPRRTIQRKPSGPYEPSPRDIRRACEHIQAAWSERERTKRSGGPPEGQWTPPSVDWAALTEAANEDQTSSLTTNGNTV